MKRVFAAAVLAFVAGADFAQEGNNGVENAPRVFESPGSTVTAPASQEQYKPLKFLLAPLHSSSIWSLRNVGDADNSELAVRETPFAKKPTEGGFSLPGSVYFGVPAKSALSTISLGVFGDNIDRFLSVTSFNDTDYKTSFGFFGFDKNSLSAGVSRRFQGGMMAGLYYNGNIVEDLLSYVTNNASSSGSVGMNASDSFTDIDYGFFGNIPGRNFIDSRSNINLMFGAGVFGIDAGYSQKLFGRAEQSSAKRDDPHNYPAYIYDTQNAILDNALVPHIDMGFHFDFNNVVFKTALGFQVDIHQRRELNKGTKYKLIDSSNYTRNFVTDKLAADYIEPAFTVRFELDFLNDNRSYLGFSFESAGSARIYSNMDDKGEFIAGIFWSEDTQTGTTPDIYENSITFRALNAELYLRPSVRYITAITSSLRIGLCGGFGMGFRFGQSETQSWQWNDKNEYAASPAPYSRSIAAFQGTVTEIPNTDIALYPNLGVGFTYEIVPGTFALNGGVGAAQELYRLRTGEVETYTQSGGTRIMPLFEQAWGKPLAQFALGAAFSFKKNYKLHTMFSSNGTSFDDASFILQFSAQF
jgi:hypothetical protein